MNIQDFLRFNHFCPLCGEPLHLYMQWVGSTCYEAVDSSNGMFDFEAFKNKDTVIKPEDQKFTLHTETSPEYPWLQILSHELRNSTKDKQAYLFWLCNPKGFKDLSFNDYEISLFKACYYRASPVIKLDNQAYKVFLKPDKKENKDLVNKEEAFAFKHTSKDTDRIYMLRLDYENAKTTIWHYVVPEEQKRNKDFKPNLFEKDMPLLKRRPKFELMNRKKLIQRFEGWIILS